MRVSSRVSLSFSFWPDSCEIFACFLKTVAGLPYDICTSVAKFSHSTGSRHAVRLSHDSLATYFGEKFT